jgi:hypothetical protein
MTGRARRRPAWYWPTVFLLSGVATFGYISARPRQGALWDFGAFHLSGYAANRGLNPYGADALNDYARTFQVTTTVPNLNPPLSVPLFQWLATTEPTSAFRVWWWVSLVIQTAGVAWLVRRGPDDRLVRTLWALSLAGFWMNLGLGQIYAPLAALAIAAYDLEKDWPVLAGLCIGVLVAWKPHLVLWPCCLLFAGHRRSAVAALATAAALSAVPLLVLGPDVYRAWAAALSQYHGMQVATNVSVTAWLLAAMPMPRTVTAAAGAAIGASLWHLIRTRPSWSSCSDLALASALALAPISWAGYTLLLLPVFLHRAWTVSITLSAALFACPANVLWEWSTAHPDDVCGPRLLYPLAIVLLVWGVLHTERPRISVDGVARPAAP